MSNWKGYLLKTVGSGTTPGVVFPNKYINWASWSATPEQREELVAYRDDNSRELHRVTAEGKKSVFSFVTRKKLTLAEKDEILHFFTDNEVDPVQRKIQLEYWNDATSNYKTGYFYRPNMQFKIVKISDTNIWYDEMTFEFIEY